MMSIGSICNNRLLPWSGGRGASGSRGTPPGAARSPDRRNPRGASCRRAGCARRRLQRSGPRERKLLVLERQYRGDSESRLLQVILELPAHVEVVAPCRESVPGIGLEQRFRPRAEGLVPEQVVDLGEIGRAHV